MNDTTTAKTEFVSEIKQRNLMPLWDVYEELVVNEPARTEPSMLWRWEEMRHLVERSGDLIKGKEAEHRVLILDNPHLPGPPATTKNIVAAYQCVLPGEKTSPHRHSPAAARVILEGSGGATFVDGIRCDMHARDLIITPNWTWHCHANDTAERAIWIDILDLPLVGQLDAIFGQMNKPEADPYPVLDPEKAPHSPVLRYPWSDMTQALDRAAPDADGSILARYEDPRNGGPLLPTLDCYAVRLAKGRPTRACRETSNELIIVLEGEGQSRIGDVTHDWGPNDIFTVPHWAWSSHTAKTEQAHLAVITDRHVMDRLGLLRSEVH